MLNIFKSRLDNIEMSIWVLQNNYIKCPNCNFKKRNQIDMMKLTSIAWLQLQLPSNF